MMSCPNKGTLLSNKQCDGFSIMAAFMIPAWMEIIIEWNGITTPLFSLFIWIHKNGLLVGKVSPSKSFYNMGRKAIQFPRVMSFDSGNGFEVVILLIPPPTE